MKDRKINKKEKHLIFFFHFYFLKFKSFKYKEIQLFNSKKKIINLLK
jgi:hypothetical protein